MSTGSRGRPRAAEMHVKAATFVVQAKEFHRISLDYSVSSLRVVDFVIDGMRRVAPDQNSVARTLLGLGAYLGEVMVRRAGAVWVDLDAHQRSLFAQQVGVRMPDGRVWNPLGKVLNRFSSGPEESLQTFYLTLHGRARPAAL